MRTRERKTIRSFAALMMLGAVAAGIPLLVVGRGDDGEPLVLLAGALLVAYGLAAVRIWMLAAPREEESPSGESNPETEV